MRFGGRVAVALGLVVLLCAGPGPAYAKACKPLKTKVTVKLQDPKVKIIHANTVTEINRMMGNRDTTVGAGMNEWHTPGGNSNKSVIRGLTRASLTSGYSFHPYYQKTGSRYCYTIRDVTVKFGFKDHVVFIPRIYAPHSCEYKVVHAHEMTHVQINRQALKKFLPKLKAAVAKHLASKGAAVVKSEKAGVAAMQKVINDALAASIVSMYKYSTPLHNKIDTPRSYKREDAKCKKWVRDVR